MADDPATEFVFYLDEEDEFLIVNKTLACAFGLNESIVLRRIHKWVKHNRKKQSEMHLKDGLYWTFNTIEEWRDEEFPFWGYDTVRYALIALEKLGLIFVGNYNDRKGDRTKWYTVNYAAYYAYLQLWIHHKRPMAGNGRRNPAYAALLEDWKAQRPTYTNLVTYHEQFGNLPSAIWQLTMSVTNIDQQHKTATKTPRKKAASAQKQKTSEPPQEQQAPLSEPEPLPAISPDVAKVFTAYHDNMGLMSSMLADKIKLAIEDYGADWIIEAIGKALENNKRTWAYVDGILRNWRANGKDAKPKILPFDTGGNNAPTNVAPPTQEDVDAQTDGSRYRRYDANGKFLGFGREESA